jgi:hypothetical protein
VLDNAAPCWHSSLQQIGLLLQVLIPNGITNETQTRGIALCREPVQTRDFALTTPAVEWTCHGTAGSRCFLTKLELAT